MRIHVQQIPPEGLRITESLSAQDMDLGTDVIVSRDPVNVTADISRVTDTVLARVRARTQLHGTCSRCLADLIIEVNKEFDLNYPLEKTATVITMDPDIREELVLDLPVQPLCAPGCKGLCQACGKNKNEGGCTCGST